MPYLLANIHSYGIVQNSVKSILRKVKGVTCHVLLVLNRPLIEIHLKNDENISDLGSLPSIFLNINIKKIGN